MQNPWKLNFELLKQTSKSISERFFFSCHEHGTKKQFRILVRNRISDLQIHHFDDLLLSHRDFAVSSIVTRSTCEMHPAK